MSTAVLHPMPHADDGIKPYFVQGKHYFAFSSLEQLKRWVYKSKWRKDLAEFHIKLVKFEAEGHHGDTQAIYDPDTRGPHEVLDLATI